MHLWHGKCLKCTYTLSMRLTPFATTMQGSIRFLVLVCTQPEFIEMLGLKQSLTPSRNNGFLNMLKLMQRKTLEVVAAQVCKRRLNLSCS